MGIHHARDRRRGARDRRGRGGAADKALKSHAALEPACTDSRVADDISLVVEQADPLTELAT
jgi:hypothetical protein